MSNDELNQAIGRLDEVIEELRELTKLLVEAAEQRGLRAAS
jgi:hypothetical protein